MYLPENTAPFWCPQSVVLAVVVVRYSKVGDALGREATATLLTVKCTLQLKYPDIVLDYKAANVLNPLKNS
nr:hypothetical protein CFP56_29349 [Quercus suber]